MYRATTYPHCTPLFLHQQYQYLRDRRVNYSRTTQWINEFMVLVSMKIIDFLQ